jgi:hypothetical protein
MEMAVLNLMMVVNPPYFLATMFDATIIFDAASTGSFLVPSGVVPVCASRLVTVNVNQRYPCAPVTIPIDLPLWRKEKRKIKEWLTYLDHAL